MLIQPLLNSPKEKNITIESSCLWHLFTVYDGTQNVKRYRYWYFCPKWWVTCLFSAFWWGFKPILAVFGPFSQQQCQNTKQGKILCSLFSLSWGERLERGTEVDLPLQDYIQHIHIFWWFPENFINLYFPDREVEVYFADWLWINGWGVVVGNGLWWSVGWAAAKEAPLCPSSFLPLH